MSTDLQVQHKHELSELTTQSFLPRLQLMGSNSGAVKEDKCPRGWALIFGKDQYEPLGREVNVIVVTYRPKAMDVSDAGQIISVFDKDSDEFKRIQKESEVQNSGCMWGPEFLVYVPDAKGRSKWALLFMASKTARREAGNFKGILAGNCCATLKTTLIDNGKYKWDAPQIFPCSTPLEPYPLDERDEQLESFNNPKAQEVEVAPLEEARDR